MHAHKTNEEGLVTDKPKCCDPFVSQTDIVARNKLITGTEITTLNCLCCIAELKVIYHINNTQSLPFLKRYLCAACADL